MGDTAGAALVYICLTFLGASSLVGAASIITGVVARGRKWLNYPLIVILSIIGGVIGVGVAWGLYNG